MSGLGMAVAEYVDEMEIPRAGQDGFFELDGVRYATLHGWMKYLGVKHYSSTSFCGIPSILGQTALGRELKFYSELQVRAMFPERFAGELPHADERGFFIHNGMRYGSQIGWSRFLGLTIQKDLPVGIDGLTASNQILPGGFFAEDQIRALYPERFAGELPRAGADGFFDLCGERYGYHFSWKEYLSRACFRQLSGGLDGYSSANKFIKGGFYRKQQLMLAFPHLFEKHLQTLLASFQVSDFSDWLGHLRHFYDFLELGPIDRPYPLALVNLFTGWSRSLSGRFPFIKRYLKLLEDRPKQMVESNREGHSHECIYLSQKDFALWVEQGQPTKETSGDLILRAQSGDPIAETAVVRQYERLVRRLAYKYKGALSLEDAIQEGMIGLMRALKKYDPAKGSFENHARWWVRAGITLAVKNTSRDVRLSGKVLEEKRNIERVVSETLNNRGDKPSDEELVHCTGLTRECIKAVMAAFSARSVSLDAPVGDAEGRPFHEVLADSRVHIDPVESANFETFLLRARVLMDFHKYGRYWPIFLNAFGCGDEIEPYQVVAGKLGITRVAVRHRVFRALECVLDDPQCSQFLLDAGVSEATLAAKFEQIDNALNRGRIRK